MNSKSAVRDIKIIPALLKGLAESGICRGDCLIVHSSFKSLGFKASSPMEAVKTLIELVGGEGTVMMPAFSYSYSGIWNVCPFNRETTPGIKNGVLSEALRRYPGALRSAHPTYSVAAYGRYARLLTENRESRSALGPGSSYEAAYRLGAKILLIGVGNKSNSMIHYAEAAAGLPYNDIPFREFWGRTALVQKTRSGIIELPVNPPFPACSGNFGVVDRYLTERGMMRTGKACMAECMIMNSRDMVEAVVRRLKTEPGWLLCDSIVCEPCTLRKKRLLAKGMI